MRTFQENDCLGNIPNAEIWQQLREYAISKGVPVYQRDSIKSYTTYKNLKFFEGEICGNRSVYGRDQENWITFEQFFEYCDNWSKCQPSKVKLNDEYTAEIQDGKVKVGCQYFTFEAIEELYKQIQKAKS